MLWRDVRVAQFLRVPVNRTSMRNHLSPKLRLGLELESVHQAIELIKVIEVHDQLTSPFLATGSDLDSRTQMLTQLPGQFLMLMLRDIDAGLLRRGRRRLRRIGLLNATFQFPNGPPGSHGLTSQLVTRLHVSNC